MGVREFKIIFDKPLKTYLTGETVKGKIYLFIDSVKKCRGVRIKITGEARTLWPRSVNDNSGNHDIRRRGQFSGHEEYFSSKTYLIGSNTDEVELSPGKHNFSFEFVVPQQLPSSFESELGHIRYSIKATVDRPWRFDNETKAAFTVVSKCDLNSYSNAKRSIVIERSQTFGCFSQTPPIKVRLYSPASGYVPGQSIPVKVEIDNRSGLSIFNVKFSLVKHVTYRATQPSRATKHEKSFIIHVRNGGIQENVTCIEKLLAVPPTPPSSLGNCKMIDVRYELKLEVCVSSMCSGNMKITAPILIGTVPLENHRSLVASSVESRRGRSSPSTPRLPSTTSLAAPAPSAPSSSAPPDYNLVVNSAPFDLPPPTYEESIYAAENLQGHDDSDHVIGIGDRFSPRYPVYNFNSRHK